MLERCGKSSHPNKAGRHPMPQNLSPWAFVLAVPDLEASASYYRDVLGFRVLWRDATDWRVVERDGVRIMLGLCPDAAPAASIFPHDWFAYIEVDDVDAFHDEIAARGATCTKPREQPYGMREIIVTTADGHRIVFAHETRGG
jgi:catechol 2,3-dioxygenase-like lactoylglutathione lyase family enzyme